MRTESRRVLIWRTSVRGPRVRSVRMYRTANVVSLRLARLPWITSRSSSKVGAANGQVNDKLRVQAKADMRDGGNIRQQQYGSCGAVQQLDEEWGVSAGARWDERQNAIKNASAFLSQNGPLGTDGQVKVDYKPKKAGGKPGEKEDWDVYGFTQATLARDGDRTDNNRARRWRQLACE